MAYFSRLKYPLILGQMTSEFNSDLFISFPSPFVVAVDTQTNTHTHGQTLKWFYICPMPWIALDRQERKIKVSVIQATVDERLVWTVIFAVSYGSDCSRPRGLICRRWCMYCSSPNRPRQPLSIDCLSLTVVARLATNGLPTQLWWRRRLLSAVTV